MPDTPQRRADDCVSFRTMVEYVSDQEAKWHTVRAESLMFIGNALEKLEASLNEHETWHRDVLETTLQEIRLSTNTDKQFGAQYRLALWAVVVSVVALVSTTVLLVLQLARG